MTAKRTFILAIACLFFAILFGSRTIGQANDRVEIQQPRDFDGDVVVVSFRRDRDYGVLLEHPRIRRLGDTHFLVGTGRKPAKIEGWRDGRVTWMPLSEVEMLVEFENYQAYLDMLEDFEIDQDGRAPGF